MLEIRQIAFSCRAVQIRSSNRAIGDDRRNRALVASKAALDVEGFPWTRFFIFCNAKCVFFRPSQRRLASRSWIRAPDVLLDQANTTSDRRVGAPAFP